MFTEFCLHSLNGSEHLENLRKDEEDNINMCLRELECEVNWIELAYGRVQ
jgi:hypothetical protein